MTLASIPVCHRPFLLVAEASARRPCDRVEVRHLIQMPTFAKAMAGNRSTGSKQTSKGLFICLSERGIGKVFLDYQLPNRFRIVSELFSPEMNQD